MQGSQNEREEGGPSGRKGTQSGMPPRWPGLQQTTYWLASHGGWEVSRGDTGPLCLGRLQEGGGGENMGQKGRVQAFLVFCLLSLTGQFAKNRWEEPEPQVRVWFGLVWASEETKGAHLGRQREGGTGVAAALCQSPGVLGLA